MSTAALWTRLNPNPNMGTQGAPSWTDLMSVYPLGDQAREGECVCVCVCVCEVCGFGVDVVCGLWV